MLITWFYHYELASLCGNYNSDVLTIELSACKFCFSSVVYNIYRTGESVDVKMTERDKFLESTTSTSMESTGNSGEH